MRRQHRPAHTVKMRTGPQLRRPTHALGKMIQAQEEGVPFVITRTAWPTRDRSGIRTSSMSGIWPRRMSPR
jgi:hypothetical protein